MRWYEVQNDMRVYWCSAADAAATATARAVVGRMDVASGPDVAMSNVPGDGTGKEAVGFLRSQGRNFTPERSSTHVVAFAHPQ